LLNEIARQWALNKFDIKFLIRGILGSRPYQLTSAATHGSQDNPQHFARMAVRSLTAEQLFDSVAEVCEYKSPDERRSRPFDRMNGATPRDQFRDRFTDKGNRTESETTILQALFLMNGNFMANATSLDKNRALGTIAAATGTDTKRRIETIYLVTLSRKPR